MQSMQKTSQWGGSDPSQIKGEKLLLYWLCDAMKPYETVENNSFKTLMAFFDPKFKLPSEKVIRTKLIPELNTTVQFAMMEAL